MRPHYRNDCLVNLVRSFELAHQLLATGSGQGDGRDLRSVYEPLAELPPEVIADRPKTVLIVIDGLGYNRIVACRQAPNLQGALRGSAKSVFPSTTASAVTSLLTGVGPLQHGLTGWFLWCGAAAQIVTPLPYEERFSGRTPAVSAERLFSSAPWWSRHSVCTYLVMPSFICDSAYTQAHGGDAQRVAFSGLEGMFGRVLDTLSNHRNGPCHVHAYWPRFDALSHEHGTWSERASQELSAIDDAFGRFVEACPKGEVNVVLTADHGFIDSPPESRVSLADHPELAAMLIRPLTGEPRVAYCSPHPQRESDFCAYVDERLGHQFSRVPAGTLIDEHYFGRGEPHPEFSERIGEQALIAKGHHVIGDGLDADEPVFKLTGFHGGVSEDEMLVPLVVAAP